MKKLSHLPNISPEIEAKLHAAGVFSYEELKEKGSRNVFTRIKMNDSGACYNTLLSLEGAIRGKLSDELDASTREELRLFMEIFNR